MTTGDPATGNGFCTLDPDEIPAAHAGLDSAWECIRTGRPSGTDHSEGAPE